MTNVSIAAVLRSPAYSPNHIATDAAILNSVCSYLRRRGRGVKVYTESELQQGLVKEPVVISMCRERTSLALLQEMEDAGRLVINSAYGIENCKRELLGGRLTAAGIRYPENIVTRTDRNVCPELEARGFDRCWVKRADSHSQHKEDITFASSPAEAQEIVHEYFMRGIPTAVIERHIEGTHIKFYGVAGTDFFHCYHRAGRDAVNGYDPARLAEVCDHAARVLNLKIYGGDAIIDSATGEATIINVNDWPSFAPCRSEAVKPISGLILSLIKKK